MNENIDLTKILYGCPKGAELYNTIYGKVKFLWVDFSNKLPIVLSTYTDVVFHLSKDGKLISNYDGECTLFPSKDQRDWSKFVRFWDKPKVEKFDPKTLQPFDKVLTRDESRYRWNVNFFGYINADKKCLCSSSFWNQCIPYNDDTKHLLGTTDDCPEYYRWWEE